MYVRWNTDPNSDILFASGAEMASGFHFWLNVDIYFVFLRLGKHAMEWQLAPLSNH